ncbi:MAG: dihydrodipicolinate synthase family protein [Phycisphaerae bacterium]|nr:dihydrodipicolinate synthase family protein [Phycisphaerae bacterium]
MDRDTKIEGFIAAPLTGYHTDGSINLDIVPRYADMLHAAGVAGVFVNGTTGEGLSLTLEERKSLAAQWVNAAPDGLRVIVHVGHTCQRDSQRLAVHAAKIGAYGVAEIGPVFFRPASLEALVEYTAATASCVPDLPYYYYHMPSLNQVLFPMVRFLELADTVIPNLAGIKYTHDDIHDCEACMAYHDRKYDILFGRDECLLQGLKTGVRGAVGSTYNIMVSLYHELVESFHAGDLEHAQQLQEISAATCRILHDTGGFGSGLKAVMRKMGFDLGGMRRPQLNLSCDTIGHLESDLQAAGTFEYLNRG